MKFYKHFIGDYRKKTNRLSPLEHGVYRLLLDELYGTEDPLPLDEIELQNIVGVRTDQDAKALRKILDRYFTLTPSGWDQRAGDGGNIHGQCIGGEKTPRSGNQMENKF